MNINNVKIQYIKKKEIQPKVDSDQKVMYIQKQQLHPKQQHTSSRLLQSLLHTYTEGQNNHSQIAQSQATIHDLNYEEGMSYRSNTSEKQESRLIELIEKKESQLKTLETFLIKEFEQISENKEKHARFRADLDRVLMIVIGVKEEIEMQRRIRQELEEMKHFVGCQVQKLFELFRNQSQKTNKSYEDEIFHLQKIISSQQEQISQLKSLTIEQSHQINKLADQLAHNPLINSLQLFKLEEEHLNKAISKKQSKGQLSEEELEVSFSADKNNKAKQLINAIFHLKSNESLLLDGKDGGEIRNSNKTVEEEHSRRLGEQQRTLTGGFNHILLKGSTSSHSHSSQNEIQPQQINSPPQRSQCIQTSEVRRISSNANYAVNDASSAINKLDVFSELNAGENYQDDDMSYFQHDDQNFSEIQFRNMKKAKISRSMKATRNPAFRTFDASLDGQKKQAHNQQIKTQEPTFTYKKQSYNTPPQQPKQPLHPIEESFHKNPPIPSNQPYSPKDESESPNTQKKKAHRYDYCRLYEEQQIKEIENINTMCNHLMLNDRLNVVPSTTSQLSAFNSFDKWPNDLSPTKKSREISPRKSSFSKLQPSKFDYNHERQIDTKTFVRSGNPVSPFSNSKKPLTIEIPASPQRTEDKMERGLRNPYLKLQNHLHQISCQDFSPKRSRCMNERKNSGYLDRSEGRSMASYSDQRNEIREDLRGLYLESKTKYQLQQKSRKTPPNSYEEPNISNNMDRKQYIKSKIEMIKKKNMVQNISYTATKSPQKITFLKSQEPENQISKQELQRPNISRQVSRHTMSIHQQNQPIKGYDFSEDKFEKEMMEKSRRTEKSQLQNSTLSKVDLQKSKDVSRMSYANNNNTVTHSKIDKIEKAKQNLKKSTSNVTISQQQQYNDIYQQLNHDISPQNQQFTQDRNSSIQQSVSKKNLNRPTEPFRQSVSPLRPTSKNTNNMYLPQESHKFSIKKSTSMMENQHLEERYNEENLYKHPYMMDRRRGGDARGNRNDDYRTFENIQMFRRF